MHKHPSHTGMHTPEYVCVHTLIKTETLFFRFLPRIGMFYVNSQGKNVSLIEFIRKSFSLALLAKGLT